MARQSAAVVRGVLVLVCTLVATTAHAAIVERVQSGTLTHNTNGTQTVTITAVDPARSLLIFQARHTSNRPSGSMLRGTLASATTIEFTRVSNETGAIVVQWYVVTFGSGVSVQRGEVDQTAATVNVPIAAVTRAQAFVLWSKTTAQVNNPNYNWDADEHVLADLTSGTNLQFRSEAANSSHRIAWQVVEFTTPADINVQRGTLLSPMTGNQQTAAATIPTAVDPGRTFVLASFRSSGSGVDIGRRMLSARLTGASTITFDRGAAGTGDDITEIAWQAVELRDGSRVWHNPGGAPFGSSSTVPVTLNVPQVNPTRAVAFASVEMGAGQAGGRSSYTGDDVAGVCSVTTAIAPTQLTLQRSSTASTCDVGWFVVQFAGSTGFKAGSFTKSIATGTQSFQHGLGETPKALILWTAHKAPTCAGGSGVSFKAAASGGANSGIWSLTIDKPAGTSGGDAMIASIGLRPANGVITPPAGWSLLSRTDNTTGTPNTLAVYAKVAEAGEPATYTWTFSASGSFASPTGSSGGIQTYCGAALAAPVQASQTTPSGWTHSTPSINTTVPNSMVVTTHSFSSAATWTPPPGMTEAFDVGSMNSGNGVTTLGSYAIQATPGATGVKTATISADPDSGNTHIVALTPAPAPGGIYWGFGMTDGTTSRSATTSSVDNGATALAARRMAPTPLSLVRWDQVVVAEATFTSWDATSVTLNWTTNDNIPGVIHYVAIGGSDISAKVLDWITPQLPGDVSVTGVGFQPSVVLHAHAGGGFTSGIPAIQNNGAFGLGAMDFNGDQWANAFLTVDGTTTSDTQHGQQTDAAFYALINNLGISKEATWRSMDADGFTMNFTATNNSAARAFSLALKGLNVKPGSFKKATNAAPASQPVTGAEFQPEVVLLTSVQDTTQTAPLPHTRFALGASDGLSEGSSALTDQDLLPTSSADAFDRTDKVFVKVNNDTATIDAEADLTSLDPDGFTLNWTTNDAVATEILYLALAPLNATEVRLTSLTAHRHARGVLIQWRTGYEINNLGFHVYRDVGGQRTRITTVPVAGSGLQVGRDQAVDGELGYAWWDLEAPPSGVTYWLEDLDFDGTNTWHGPVAPADGGLSDVDASVVLGDPAQPRRGKILLSSFTSGGDPALTSLDAEAAAAIETQWMLAAASSIKIGVVRPGWYRIDRDALLAAGLDPAVDPRNLRLYLDGVEQAIVVAGESDGRLDAGDGVEFYGTGVDTTHTNTRVYWLTAAAGPGRRVARGTAPGAPAPASDAGFRLTRQVKERTTYFAALRNGDTENWFGAFVSEWFPTQMTLDLANLSAAPSTAARIEVALQGVGTTAGVEPDHVVGVLVNGTEVGEMRFDGQAREVAAFDVPHAILREGANTIELVARAGEEDTSLVDAVRLTYWHAFRADADLLRLSAAGQQPITIEGFSSDAIRVVDVTDPAAPVELPGVGSIDGRGLHATTVTPSGTGTRTLVAFTAAAAGLPSFVRADAPSSWNARTNRADYVIVTHARFGAAMERLANLRRGQGHTVAVVDVEDVYDEFFYGEKAPEALREFFTRARTAWRQAPKFVVLGGDATIDPRDYAGFGDADFVPTRQVAMTTVALETASDDWFVDSDDDGMTEMAIGRLPMRTAAHADAMVAKLEAYDAAPAGAWMQEVALVADEDQVTTGFEAAAAAIAAGLPSDYRSQTVLPRLVGRAAARTAIASLANAGQLVVNYIGHGSTRVWGTHADLLTAADVAGWDNTGRYPLVVAMNCLNGFFNGIYDEESLAETFLRTPNAGAIGVWASSSTTPSATQSLVNQELFRLLFSGTFATVGEAAAAAKNVVADRDLRRSWIYFGDPALRLRGVRHQPTPPLTPVTLAAVPEPASGNAAGSTARVVSIRLADFNGDGRADGWVYSPGSGEWSAAYSSASGFRYRRGSWEPSWTVTAARLNDDARTDFVLWNPATGEWRQALTGGEGIFTISNGTSTTAGQLEAGDFTGDRLDDALVYDAVTGAWALLVTDGGGGVAATFSGAWDKIAAVHVADVTADGLADVLGYDPQTGRGFLAVNRGEGVFSVTRPHWGKDWEIAFANLNGDGATDVLFYDPNTGAWMRGLNDGAAVFTPATGTWQSGMRPHLADLDGDGDDDVFAYDRVTGRWTIGVNQGTGVFVEHGGWFAPHWAVATGDVDGDGRADLVLHDETTGNWFQCLMLDPGVFRYVPGTWLSDTIMLGTPRREFNPVPKAPGPPQPRPWIPTPRTPVREPEPEAPTPTIEVPAEPPVEETGPAEPPRPVPPETRPERGRRGAGAERGKPSGVAVPRGTATPRPPLPGVPGDPADPPRKAIPRLQQG